MEHTIFGIQFDNLDDSDEKFEHIDYGSEYDHFIHKDTLVVNGNVKCHIVVSTYPSDGKISYELCLVPSPKSVRPRQRRSYAQSSCVPEDELEVMDMVDNGCTVLLECEDVPVDESEGFEGERPDKYVLDKIASVIPFITRMIGYRLDRYQNRIGNTGWDMLSHFVYGTDLIKTALRRYA